MKIVYTGLESSGKTLQLAHISRQLLAQNKKWQKKYGFTREIYSNLTYSKSFLKEGAGFIKQWQDSSEIVGKWGIDIIWDEISTDFSALKQNPMAKRVNGWLRQGDKQGVNIYATAQEFHDVHLDFRRRVHRAFILRKFIGSSRGGENLPPVNNIWGLCFISELQIRPYNELEPKLLNFIPRFLFITKALCHVFDTHQLIPPSEYPEFEHIRRECKECGFIKVIHR